MKSIKARSTKPNENRFTCRFRLKTLPNGTLEPIPRNEPGTHKCWVELEYPTYEKELEFRRKCQKTDPNTQQYMFDSDLYNELRVKYCLVDWNLHTIDNLTGTLDRQNGFLTDKSFEHWKLLPPLVRKRIINLIDLHIGG